MTYTNSRQLLRLMPDPSSPLSAHAIGTRTRTRTLILIPKHLLQPRNHTPIPAKLDLLTPGKPQPLQPMRMVVPRRERVVRRVLVARGGADEAEVLMVPV